MTIEDFKTYVKTRKPLDTEEIHRFMDEMSNEARRVTFRLNAAYHTPDEVRGLLSELFGYEVPQSLRVFPPLYADFGKNITVGEDVFINACCHFQDHGGVMIGDGCQIGHNVVFATLNHGLAPEERKSTYPAPIVLGRNVWVGSNATILQGVTIGDNAVVAAGAVVTKDVAANTVVGGVPARFIKNINDKLKVKADADLKHNKLTLAQSRVLAFLDSRGGQATQKEIEVYLEVSHPTVVGIISRMEQNGHLRCWVDETDKRNKIVALTEQAEALGEEMEQRILANEKMLLASLSEADIKKLKRMLLIIYNNLE